MSVNVSPVTVSNPMRRAVLRGLPLAPVHHHEAAADVTRSETADGANAIPLLLLLSALLPLRDTAGRTEKASSLALTRSIASTPIMLLVGNIVARDGLWCVLCEGREDGGSGTGEETAAGGLSKCSLLSLVVFHVHQSVRVALVRKSLPRLHQKLHAPTIVRGKH